MKYNCCGVGGPVNKCESSGAGLKLCACELDIIIIDINNACGGCCFHGGVMFGAWFGKSLITGKRITCCC